MKIITTAIVAFMLSTAGASPVLAVDKSISTLCRADTAGDTYQRPGGFCDAVASNKSLGSGGGASNCPVGYIKVDGHCTLI